MLSTNILVFLSISCVWGWCSDEAGGCWMSCSMPWWLWLLRAAAGLTVSNFVKWVNRPSSGATREVWRSVFKTQICQWRWWVEFWKALEQLYRFREVLRALPSLLQCWCASILSSQGAMSHCEVLMRISTECPAAGHLQLDLSDQLRSCWARNLYA